MLHYVAVVSLKQTRDNSLTLMSAGKTRVRKGNGVPHWPHMWITVEPVMTPDDKLKVSQCVMFINCRAETIIVWRLSSYSTQWLTTVKTNVRNGAGVSRVANWSWSRSWWSPCGVDGRSDDHLTTQLDDLNHTDDHRWSLPTVSRGLWFGVLRSLVSVPLCMVFVKRKNCRSGLPERHKQSKEFNIMLRFLCY